MLVQWIYQVCLTLLVLWPPGLAPPLWWNIRDKATCACVNASVLGTSDNIWLADGNLIDGAENTLESCSWGSTRTPHDKGCVCRSSHRGRRDRTRDPICLPGQGGKGGQVQQAPLLPSALVAPEFYIHESLQPILAELWDADKNPRMNKLRELASEHQASDLGASVRSGILMPRCVLGIPLGTVGNATLTAAASCPFPFQGQLPSWGGRAWAAALYVLLRGECPRPGLARCPRGQGCSPPHCALGQPHPRGWEGDCFGTTEVGAWLLKKVRFSRVSG